MAQPHPHPTSCPDPPAVMAGGPSSCKQVRPSSRGFPCHGVRCHWGYWLPLGSWGLPEPERGTEAFACARACDRGVCMRQGRWGHAVVLAKSRVARPDACKPPGYPLSVEARALDSGRTLHDGDDQPQPHPGGGGRWLRESLSGDLGCLGAWRRHLACARAWIRGDCMRQGGWGHAVVLAKSGVPCPDASKLAAQPRGVRPAETRGLMGQEWRCGRRRQPKSRGSSSQLQRHGSSGRRLEAWSGREGGLGWNPARSTVWPWMTVLPCTCARDC